MNSKSKLFALVVASCLLFGTAAWADDGDNTATKTADAAKKQPVQLLFVIQAKHGALKYVAGKQYTLTIPLQDINSVLVFSDRPNRIAKRISPASYAKLVHTGKDTFDENPPNATVIVNNSPGISFEIVSYSKTATNIIYSLSRLDAPIAKNATKLAQGQTWTGQVALFVDDTFTYTATCSEGSIKVPLGGACLGASTETLTYDSGS